MNRFNRSRSAQRINMISLDIEEFEMTLIDSGLEDLQKEEEAKRSEGLAAKNKIEWGSQIRNYVLHPYRMVKDMRTGVESGAADKVLDGELIEFMEAWLVQRSGSDGGRNPD